MPGSTLAHVYQVRGNVIWVADACTFVCVTPATVPNRHAAMSVHISTLEKILAVDNNQEN